MLRIKYLLLIGLFLLANVGFSQVKIGQQPNEIHPASLVELESNEKVFVLTRVTSAEMNAIIPLNGALVYNTDQDCVFMYEGSIWRNLCGSTTTITRALNAPPFANTGDLWINNQTGVTHVWDGILWVAINVNPRRGNGIPTTANLPDATAGDIYVDEATGGIYAFDGSSWVSASTVMNADNGLTVTSGTIELGGPLLKPTTIETDTTNTLAIQGLQNTPITPNLEVVTVDTVSGVLQTTQASSLMQEEVVLRIANEGQNQFITPLPINDSKKVNVYRNGVRIDFTVIDNNTIELEAGVICYQNDGIRIVQFY